MTFSFMNGTESYCSILLISTIHGTRRVRMDISVVDMMRISVFLLWSVGSWYLISSLAIVYLKSAQVRIAESLLRQKGTIGVRRGCLGKIGLPCFNK